MNYALRLDALRRSLPRLKCGAIVISDLTNVRYLTGFTGTSGLIVATKNSATFFTDFRYREQAALQVGAEYDVSIVEARLWNDAAKLIKDKKIARVGFEAEDITVATLEDITSLLQPSIPVATKGVVQGQRLFKDEDELKIIRRAVQIADKSLETVCGIMKPGMAEQEIADALLAEMKRRGASGASFETIVASGKRGALPHGVASRKKLKAGEMVTIDMGAVLDGYCSDLTRTVCLGKPSARQQEIYGLVWDAQTAAAAALRPGMTGKEADEVARKIITDAGHGDAFGHGLGHGVGMHIHEGPRLSRFYDGKLEAGMVVTCEPGIYLAGWGGVRIEDMLVMTETGAEILSKAKKPRKIIELAV